MELDLTHIDGLDADLLAGGIPKGSAVLLAGAPGTMKSSVAFTTLFNNALRGRRGVYMSLEQGRDSLVHHMRGLGMDPDAAGGNLSILDLGALREKFEGDRGPAWLDLFKMYGPTPRTSFPYEFLVLDSLNALEILAQFERMRRGGVRGFTLLRGLRSTSLVITELPPDVEMGGGDPAFAQHPEGHPPP